MLHMFLIYIQVRVRTLRASAVTAMGTKYYFFVVTSVSVGTHSYVARKQSWSTEAKSITSLCTYYVSAKPTNANCGLNADITTTPWFLIYTYPYIAHKRNGNPECSCPFTSTTALIRMYTLMKTSHTNVIVKQSGNTSTNSTFIPVSLLFPFEFHCSKTPLLYCSLIFTHLYVTHKRKCDIKCGLTIGGSVFACFTVQHCCGTKKMGMDNQRHVFREA